jgi:hypothetical protein
MRDYNLLESLRRTGKIELPQPMTTREFAQYMEIDSMYMKKIFNTEAIMFNMGQYDEPLYLTPYGYAQKSATFFVDIPPCLFYRKRKNTIEKMKRDMYLDVAHVIARIWNNLSWKEYIENQNNNLDTVE